MTGWLPTFRCRSDELRSLAVLSRSLMSTMSPHLIRRPRVCMRGPGWKHKPGAMNGQGHGPRRPDGASRRGFMVAGPLGGLEEEKKSRFCRGCGSSSYVRPGAHQNRHRRGARVLGPQDAGAQTDREESAGDENRDLFRRESSL